MVELFTDGKAKFHIPILYKPPVHEWNLNRLEAFHVRTVLQNYQREGHPGSTTSVRFFDLFELWWDILLVLTFYRRWLGAAPVIAELQVASRLDGIWQSAPFLNQRSWGNYVLKYGLAVAIRNSLDIPEDIGRGLRVRHGDLFPWSVIGVLTLALGIPVEVYEHMLTEEAIAVAKRAGIPT